MADLVQIASLKNWRSQNGLRSVGTSPPRLPGPGPGLLPGEVRTGGAERSAGEGPTAVPRP